MTIAAFFSIFVTVFLAELGDKTQLAALLFATDDQHNPWLVFAATSVALVTSSALAVLLGHYISAYMNAVPIKLLAGIGFMLIGGWIVFEHFKNVPA